MQLKSTRGVQQDDVWGAADALVGQGLRPTIERVRQKIGRGSPNTVSPMLEAWFATLGSRLGAGGPPQDAAKVPMSVQQAAAKLWEAALLLAREEAAKEFEQAQKAMAADHSAILLRGADMERREEVWAQRQIAADEALLVARSQAADLSARLQESHALMGRRENEIADLRARLMALETQRDAERRRSDEDALRHAEERGQLEARSAASERRLLEEVDRQRQEAKLAKSALADAEQRARSSRNELETVSRDLGAELALARQCAESRKAAVESLSQAAQEAQTRINGLLDQIAEHTRQRASQIGLHAAVQGQLSVALQQLAALAKPARSRAQSKKTP